MDIQEDMSNNVCQVAKAMHTQAYASISTQKDRLEAQRFDLKLKQHETSGNDALVELYQERIDEITCSIEAYDGQLEGSNAGPNRLDFDRFRRDEQLDDVCNRKQKRKGSGNRADKFDIGDEVIIIKKTSLWSNGLYQVKMSPSPL